MAIDCGTCDIARVADRRITNAGGVFIAIGAIGGVLVGGRYGQTSVGLLVGAGIGVVTALGIWLIDRSR